MSFKRKVQGDKAAQVYSFWYYQWQTSAGDISKILSEKDNVLEHPVFRRVGESYINVGSMHY